MKCVSYITVGLMLFAFGHSVHAQSFSADLINVDAAGHMAEETGKIYANNGKIRIETPDLPASFFVIDPARKTAYFVRPGQHVFMDAKQSSQWTQLLVPVDLAAPCQQWQIMAEVAGAALDGGGEWRCERVGDELVEGRTTIKYRAITSKRAPVFAWIDAKLNFPVRIRNDDGSGVNVSSIKEEAQNEGLFAIPANYGKFDPMRLIELIKHSDVWVEPPK